MPDVYPEHILQMKEFKAISAATDKQIEKLNKRINEMRDDLLISTSQESGIVYREKILKIVPLDTDTLEDRRYKVLLKWYDTYPYTEFDLRKRLDRICGVGQYILKIDKVKNTLSCLVELTSRKMLNSVRDLLEDIVSLNVSMGVGLRYNQWSTLANKKWQEVSAFTWEEKKNEVIRE